MVAVTRRRPIRWYTKRSEGESWEAPESGIIVEARIWRLSSISWWIDYWWSRCRTQGGIVHTAKRSCYLSNCSWLWYLWKFYMLVETAYRPSPAFKTSNNTQLWDSCKINAQLASFQRCIYQKLTMIFCSNNTSSKLYSSPSTCTA